MGPKRKFENDLTPEVKKIKIGSSKMFSIEEFFYRFPKLTKDIFGCVDMETLGNSVLVSKIWQVVISNQRIYYIRPIQYWLQYQDEFKEEFEKGKRLDLAFKKALDKMSLNLLKRISKYLLEHGLTRCTRCIEGDNCHSYAPIHFAVLYGDIELFCHLQSKTDDKNSKSRHGETPLRIAVKIGQLDVCKWYVNNAMDLVNLENGEEYTLLHNAAVWNQFDVFKYLFENGGDMSKKDFRGQTALHIAIRYGSPKLCKFIIENLKFEDISAEDNRGITPIFYAVNLNKIEIVKLLIKRGGHFNTKQLTYPPGHTPLHSVAESGYNELAEFILESVVDKNPKDGNGDTPLHLAAEHGFLNVCMILCKHIPIAKMNLKNNDGQTPIDLAYRNQHWKIVHFLITENKFANCND